MTSSAAGNMVQYDVGPAMLSELEAIIVSKYWLKVMAS